MNVSRRTCEDNSVTRVDIESIYADAETAYGQPLYIDADEFH
jgi:hypothetical protein